MTDLKYLSGAVFMLKFSLLYPIETDSVLYKRLYAVWGLLYFLSFFTTFIQMVVYLYVIPFNLIEEAMILMNTAIYLSMFMNFTFLYVKREKILEFVKSVNANFVAKTDNDVEQIAMSKSSELSNKLAYFWTIACVVSSLMPALLTLMGGNRTLPTLAWIPYDYETAPLYQLTYIWQLFTIINLGVIYAVLDVVFPCISLIISQQFKILASNLRNGVHKALLESGAPRHFVLGLINENVLHRNVREILQSHGFRESNAKYFIRNIEHHQLLLKYCEDLNDVLNTFLLGKVSAAIFNSVFMAFGIITSGDPALVLGLISYIASTSTELLIYTYSGQFLTQNADILWTLYEIPWYLCDLKFQKMFNIVQIRLSKDVYIKAGNYFLMTATAFITFMKALSSYVAVLKELNDRPN